MSSPLERFISQVNNLGLARTNLFNVEITTPRCVIQKSSPGSVASLINLFCQTASFPPTNIGVRELRIAGPSYKRPYNIDYGGEGISLTFLVDRNMDLKGYFDVWMSHIISPTEFNVNYNHEDDAYTTDILIKQITETTPSRKVYENNGEQTIAPVDDNDQYYYIKLEDAFPRNIAMIELDTTAQNAVHKLTVNFAYRKVIFNNRIYNSREETSRIALDVSFPRYGITQRDL